MAVSRGRKNITHIPKGAEGVELDAERLFMVEGIDGVYQVVEDNGNGSEYCAKCGFTGKCYMAAGKVMLCSSNFRHDRKSVHFERII